MSLSISTRIYFMSYSIQYPRNLLIRRGFQAIGRFLLRLLTKVEFNGMENYPSSGRLIIVGNHTGILETVMMTSFARRPIEYIGSIDIPHEPQLAVIMNAYKFIPVFRGNVSPSSMKAGLEVLVQEGVVGIFPEGGIWEPAIRKAQSGVGWLSHRGNAPVLPIGFSSTAGKLKEAINFKRPTIKMNIGKLIPPVRINASIPKKIQYEQASQRIMDAVYHLLPDEDKHMIEEIRNEKFFFETRVQNFEGEEILIPKDLEIKNGPSLSKILYRSTLINNFRDNLNMNIEPLKNLKRNPSAKEILETTGQILNYLKLDNPYYFTYRYGQKEGTQMGNGLQELQDLSKWVHQKGYTMKAIAKRTYYKENSEELIIDTDPPEIEKW